MIKCNMCGKEIIPGNDENGLPNGVGFQLENGKIINACLECIAKTSENPEYFDEFMERWKKENDGN